MGQMIGGFGDAEVFSFHATKVFHTMEGGAVTTNSDELAGRLRTMRNFGFVDFDTVAMAGTNAKMSEASAAMGLTNLASFEAFVTKNRSCHDLYCSELAGIPGIGVYRHAEEEVINHQYVVLDIGGPQFGMSRDNLIRVLHAEQVLARRYFYPGIHRMEPYSSLFPNAGRDLPRTSEIADRVLVLPTGAAMSSERIVQVCSLVRFAAENAGQIVEKLDVSSDMLGEG